MMYFWSLTQVVVALSTVPVKVPALEAVVVNTGVVPKTVPYQESQT